MRAVVRLFDWHLVPPRLRPFAKPDQTAITRSKEYLVLGISVFEAVVFLLIHDDNGQPDLVPSWFFTVIGQTLPEGWTCSLSLDEGLDLVIGPDFFARDLQAYTDLVDRTPGAMADLYAYAEEKRRTNSKTDM